MTAARAVGTGLRATAMAFLDSDDQADVNQGQNGDSPGWGSHEEREDGRDSVLPRRGCCNALRVWFLIIASPLWTS